MREMLGKSTEDNRAAVDTAFTRTGYEVSSRGILLEKASVPTVSVGTSDGRGRLLPRYIRHHLRQIAPAHVCRWSNQQNNRIIECNRT
jgi:hypothetical protein